MSTSTEPTALEMVKKTLANLKRIGSPAQRSQAEDIERQLEIGSTPRAVNFARRNRQPATTEAKS